MNRIAIVGATGSGKTILAMKVARKLGIPHLEADSVYWGPNWTPIPLEEFRRWIDMATRSECWVIDGNYSKVRDLVWGRADTVAGLDYPFLLVFWRLLQRSIPRVFSVKNYGTGIGKPCEACFLVAIRCLCGYSSLILNREKPTPCLSRSRCIHT